MLPMAPPYLDPSFNGSLPGNTTLGGSYTNAVLHDSPLETRRPVPRMEGNNSEDDDILTIRARKSKPPEKESPSEDAGANASSLRFFVVDDPNKPKDKNQMRAIRQHVMLHYLDKERRLPGRRDSRVNSSAQSHKKRKRLDTAGLNSAAPRTALRESASRLTLTESVQSNGSSHASSDRDGAGTFQGRLKLANGIRHGNYGDRHPSLRRINRALEEDDPLVPGIGGRFQNSGYLSTKLDDVPFLPHSSPLDFLGGELNPFDTWPVFSDPTVNVDELKWNCSRRFGSQGIAMHWVPTLLRARHAFLSTICICSAHDDIMSRAVSGSEFLSNHESIQRMRVRQEVISMIHESLEDPDMRTADATIVAVLHLLNSEIMGCDDRMMSTHQNGLHDMVQMRGGLDRLGVNGQLASILTITMYLIAALRETRPNRDFVEWASKRSTRIPIDSQQLPESPIYYRLEGFRTINRLLSPRSGTYSLLNDLRILTSKFFVEHSVIPVKALQLLGESTESIAGFRDKIFALAPAVDKDFRDMHERYAYEALRLVSLIYAHALASRIPFSKAAIEITRTSRPTVFQRLAPSVPNPTLPGSNSIHIQIRDALIRTDTTECWGHLAGVLFWITLVAGAAANPGPIANEERHGEDEDGRKWLAAIAVRCSIVLSFEYGSAMMETLKRMVGIEAVLSGSSEPPQRTNGSCVGPVEPPEIQMQRGFADFAQEFMRI